MRIWLAALVLGSGVLASGCSTVQGPVGMAAPCAQGRPMVETQLFMGLLRPGGSISRFEFQEFVEKEVAPRWKEGFTILEGQGLWLSEERGVTEREPSRVLVRFHDGSFSASEDIEAIRGAYITRFGQDAVLRTDRMTCADF